MVHFPANGTSYVAWVVIFAVVSGLYRKSRSRGATILATEHIGHETYDEFIALNY